MVSTITELREAISKSNILNKEITDTLLELDTLQSTGTQASLNEMLVEVYERIKNNEKITFEVLDKTLTTEEFISWVNSEFTDYSAKMFNDTIINNY